MSSKPVKYTTFEEGSLLRAVAFCSPAGRLRLDDVPEVVQREREIMQEIQDEVLMKPLTPELVRWVQQTLRYLGYKLVYLGLCRTAPLALISFDTGKVVVRWREVGVIP